MSGFFGVVSKEDCTTDLFYGTDYHSHLGTRRGGLAVYKSDGKLFRRIHDITNDPFRSKFDSDLIKFEGATAGIGIISDFEDQPLIITSKLGTFALVFVGKIANIKELTQEILQTGMGHFSEMDNSEINAAELVASLINQKDDFVEGISYAQERVEGSCSLLLLSKGGIYATRDKNGRTPIIIGKKEGSVAVAMETTAFPNLDYTEHHDLQPGEIIFIQPDLSIIQKKEPCGKKRTCAFLWVYYGYPSSTYEGVNTEIARYENGRIIAENDDVEIDSVCGVPDSGVAHAIGYSNAAARPYLRAFVKYTPTWPRSFMPQNQNVRDLVARMKLIPVRDVINGKRLLMCDDSIVRGTQLKDTVKRLKSLGAKELHMRSASPPIVFGCPFLNFSRSRTEFDLAARRAIAKIEGTLELNDEIIKPYLEFESEKYNQMVEIICNELNLTTLKYQKLERLLEAIGKNIDEVCTYCFDGQEH